MGRFFVEQRTDWGGRDLDGFRDACRRVAEMQAFVGQLA
jgi:hypothetical protein